MVLSADQQRVKTLLTETITLLCKNGLHFKTEFSIEALIGITLDDDDVFLVSIKETIRTASGARTSSDCGQSELDRHNTAEPNLSGSQQAASDCHRVTEFGSNDNDDLLQKPKSCSGKSSLQDDQRNVNEISSISPNRFGYHNLKHSLKRRFSESNDSDLKPEDCENASLACNSSNARINSDLVFPASVFGADYTSTEEFSKRSNDGYAERQGNCTEDNCIEQLSTDSCEVVEVKVEPGSEDDGSPFRASEPSNGDLNSIDVNVKAYSSGTGFPNPASYLTWNDYAQFSQHEFITSVKSNSSMALPNDDLNRTGHQSSQARPHRCSKCNKSFTTVQGRNLHEKLHDGIYQYNCPHCGKGCSGTTQLRGHMATHTQVKEFKCPICGHAYVYKKTLTDHIKRLHMDILSMPIM